VIKVTDYIAGFKALNKGDISVAGGKGASLGEMYNTGLPIPPGFVVTTDSYKEFVQEIEKTIYQKLETLDVENNQALQSTAKEIQDLILKTPIPQTMQDEIVEAYNALSQFSQEHASFVAVRSSATAEDSAEASFAGQNATYLNIKGLKAVIAGVKACWASLFTARSIYYRIKNNFSHDKVFIAVVVQKMVNSEKAGVMFSVNPVSQKQNEILIEGTYGLGEAVVSGAVTPDEYIINKENLEIIQRKIAKKETQLIREEEKTLKVAVPTELQETQLLKEHEIKILAQLAIKIEQHYKLPQDIEWATEKDRIYIVQSRPITTLSKEEPKEQSTEQSQQTTDLKEILSGLAASPGIGKGKVKIVNSPQELDKIQQGDVLVAPMTNPDMVPGMKRASAIVTDHGGMTCHAAIVSREMGIPCVVGSGKATELLKEEQEITVDGTKGKVYEGLANIKEEKPAEQPINAEPIETVIEVKVIMDLPDFAEKAAKTGADGVGLLRCEMMIAESKKHPSYLTKNNREQEYFDTIYNGVKKVAQAFKGKPIWYRTSDFRTDEYRGLEGGEEEPKESNPMMGYHGIRRGLEEQKILLTEIKAIKKLYDEGLTGIGIMLPMVTHLEQVTKSKELIGQVGLKAEFGVMIETPASVYIIEDICKVGIDFVSFGTNDLTQFTLACDRNNEHVQGLYNELHPAVLKQIENVIKVCRKYNVQTSICGQAGSNPEMASFLVQKGIDSISANPDAVHKIRQIVSQEEKKLYMDIMRKRIEQKEKRKNG
jgi:pyruvate, water dikinase